MPTKLIAVALIVVLGGLAAEAHARSCQVLRFYTVVKRCTNGHYPRRYCHMQRVTRFTRICTDGTPRVVRPLDRNRARFTPRRAAPPPAVRRFTAPRRNPGFTARRFDTFRRSPNFTARRFTTPRRRF